MFSINFAFIPSMCCVGLICTRSSFGIVLPFFAVFVEWWEPLS